MCVCPLQEWPSLSWCYWPVWTRAPTRGYTQLSPAVCPESCRTCCTVGRDLAAGVPCPTTPPPHTPPPPRTACTDRDRWDINRHTERHVWVHTHPLQGCAVRHNSTTTTTGGVPAWEQRVLTSTRCFQQQRTSVLSTGPLSVITCPLHPSSEEGCHWKCQHHIIGVLWNTQLQSVTASVMQHGFEAKTFSPQLLLSWTSCGDSYKRNSCPVQTERSRRNARGGLLH